MEDAVTFTTTLVRVPGKGGWTFAPLPADVALPSGRAWGMVPVVARLGDHTWATTVWRQHDGALLPVPVRARGRLGAGDEVTVTLAVDPDRR